MSRLSIEPYIYSTKNPELAGIERVQPQSFLFFQTLVIRYSRRASTIPIYGIPIPFLFFSSALRAAGSQAMGYFSHTLFNQVDT